MSEQVKEQPKTISREELYQKVWTVPIVQLAEQIGYSYPELVKICTALEIPRPSSGYWYRFRHGGESEQVPLPPGQPGVRAEVPFGPRLNVTFAVKRVPRSGEHGQAPTAGITSSPAPTLEKAEKETLTDTSVAELAEVSVPQRVAPKFPNVVEMTREDLYEYVWATPIHLLAEALGLSDVGLAKTCVQMEVPRPGRGYWARLDAGETMEQTRLPAPSTEAVRRWTFNVAANRKRREAWAAANLATAGKAKERVKVELPKEHELLHEIARRHHAAIEKAKPDDDGLVHLDLQGLFRCDISQAIGPKVVRAIHALVTELERRGCRFVRGDSERQHLSIVQGNDRVTVHWRENIVLIEREPTIEEKRKPSWTWQLKENKPAGRITVDVSAVGLKGARSWTESESKPLEDVLARVVEKIAATFEGFEAQRQREAEWERQRVEMEKRRAEQLVKERELEAKREKERKKKERIAKHKKKLEEIARIRRNNLWVAAQRWEDSHRVLAFIDACEKRWRGGLAGELSPAQSEWLAWARDEAKKLAPWCEDYPNPEYARRCDPATIPKDGPYPKVGKLKPNEFSVTRPPPQKPKPAPYSQYYGYSDH